MIAVYPEILKAAQARDGQILARKVSAFQRLDLQDHPLDADSLLRNFGLTISYLDLTYPGAVLLSDFQGAFSVNIVVQKELKASFAGSFLKVVLLGEYLLNYQSEIINSSRMRSWGHKFARNPLQDFIDKPSLPKTLNASTQFAIELFCPEVLLESVEKLGDPVFLDLQKKLGLPINFLLALVESKRPSLGRSEYGPALSASSASDAQFDKEPANLYSSVGPKIKVSRAIAASSYRSTQDQTSKKDPDLQAKDTSGNPSAKSPTKTSGLERIRELARKIDSSV